jgi:LysR family glycine cleavage system transcriptional activator
MSLPSLNLLRTFAVLGETLSVKRAADRLHITPPAVSHQLRELETALDCKLFVRLPRGLALTPQGQSFWDEVGPAIQQLTQATLARMRQRPLCISSFPYLAHTVVLPALGELQALLGGRLLTLDTRQDTLNLITHGMDLGLRFAPDNMEWRDLRSRRLCSCLGLPVVGTAFPQASLPPGADLAGIRLRKEPRGWTTWAQVHGWQPKGEGLEMDSYGAVLSAAEQGLGVALGLLPLCVDALETGRLRPLWPGTQVQSGALWAAWAPELESADLLRVVEFMGERLAALERRSDEFFSSHGG